MGQLAALMMTFRMHDSSSWQWLAVVGKILGHRKPKTTARYAHIADSVMNDAVNKMSRAIQHGTNTGKRLDEV